MMVDNRRKQQVCIFDGCDYRATGIFHLNQHVKAKHTPGRTRDFQCPMCPGQFWSARGLRQHIQIHVKEEKFKCNRCHFITHDKYSLWTHQKHLHDNSARKLMCTFPGCSYNTTWSDVLRRHLQTHETDPELRCPFACSIPHCEYRSSRRAYINYHVRSKHNPERQRKFICLLCQKEHTHRVHMKQPVYSSPHEGAKSSSSFKHCEEEKIPIDINQRPTHPRQTTSHRADEQHHGQVSAVKDSKIDAIPLVLLQKVILLRLV